MSKRLTVLLCLLTASNIVKADVVASQACQVPHGFKEVVQDFFKVNLKMRAVVSYLRSTIAEEGIGWLKEFGLNVSSTRDLNKVGDLCLNLCTVI